MRRLRLIPVPLVVLACAVALASPLRARVPAIVDVLEPASSGGVARLDSALARLAQHRRLLMVAAHPDDEDTRLLAAVARGVGGEAAYLSLSRGEGGQNLIGTELGPGLGLLRSRELQSARSLDGAWQLFGGAYDFGYTRSLDESLARWGKDALVDDVARAIRRFRPQVVVSVWPDDRRAGHGQHWASGAVTPLAFEVAASDRPSLDAEGLAPWRAAVLARPAWYPDDEPDAEVSFGALDPRDGRSMLQWAMASRSRHRSQDMGSLQSLGDAIGRYVRVGGPASESALEAAPASGLDALFQGIDTRLEALAALLPEGPLRTRATTDLAEVARLASEARAALSPATLEASADAIGRIVQTLAGLDSALAQAPATNGTRAFYALLAEKYTIAHEALAAAAGVAVDVFVADETLMPSQETAVSAVLWNAGGRDVGQPIVDLIGSRGVATTHAETVDTSAAGRFGGTPTFAYRLDVAVADDAVPTVPYFLERPLDGDRYDWRDVPARLRGEPFEGPPLVARFRFTIDGHEIVLEREVVARQRDQARGEVRRPLRVVPAVEVRVNPASAVWRLDDTAPHTIEIEVRNRRLVPARFDLDLVLPPSWRVDELSSSFEVAGESVWQRELAVRLPPDLAAGRYRIEAAVNDATGQRHARAIDLVEHPHVRPTPRPVASRIDISVGDIALGPPRRIGYIRGASDRVPEALERVGFAIELLGPEDLAADSPMADDLTDFDVIVVGSRAYETEPALLAANDRLLDFARAGGTVIVQYQQYGFAARDAAPFTIEIHRPHDRTTDEASSVRVLAPEHPGLSWPNEITDADWLGWVQERGLYFAGTFDDAYTPLLAMPDPEGIERTGALLVAPIGDGQYVYTGLAFFRQLPAGVLGAYRLFANLVALGEDRTPPNDG